MASGALVVRKPRSGLPRERLMAAECIQQAAMRRDVEQAAVVRLAVDFDQHGAQPAEQARADRHVIGEAARPSIEADGAPQDDLAVRRNAIFFQQLARRMVLRQIENRHRRALLRTGTYAGSRSRPRTGRQPQRIEQDGFAGAGFAGEHIEPGGERKLHILDQNEVADLERRQHRASLRWAT